MMITTKILSKNQIDDACALLYECYIVHMQWQFDPENPSKLRVIEKNGRKLLMDRFTDIATWFGAFDGDELIGCARLCGRDENNKFEIETYTNNESINRFIQQENCLEMGKIAVKKNKKKAGIIVRSIFLCAFEYCQISKNATFGGLSSTFMKNLFIKIDAPAIIKNAFKYSENDPSFVDFHFYSYDKNEIAEVIRKLKCDLSNGTSYRILDILE